MAEPKKFTDLEAASTSTEAVPVDFGTLPDQFSSREPLPQPAKGIVFKMQPVSLEDPIWDEIQTNNGPRVAVTFDPKKNKGLVIQKFPGDRYVGQQLRARISNKEREAREEGESAASDMAYLIRAAKGNDLSGQPTMEYAKEIVRLSKAGATFRADLEYSARCDPERDIYGLNKDSGEEEVLKDVKGCGQRYGMRAFTNKRTGDKTKQVPRDGQGEWQERFQCSCGAIISVFPNLRNFQPVE